MGVRVAKKGGGNRSSLRPGELQAVAGAVRTWYIGNRKVPNLDEIDSICSLPRSRITKVLMHDVFLEAMDEAGIPFRKQKGLTAHQHYALMIMTDPNDKRPHHIRLKETGVTGAQWRAWLKNPIFNSFLETFMENALGDHMNAAHLSLMNKVDKGDVRALELYYAMTGRYSASSQQERDVQAVLAGVIEIIQRNVSDQTILSKIADEMRALVGGKKELTAYRSEQIEEAYVVDDEDNETEDYDPKNIFAGAGIVYDPKNSPTYVSDKEAFLEAGGGSVSPDKVKEFDFDFKAGFYDPNTFKKS
jgi:hypothetical protein